jgi:hypothetical protein
MRASATSRRRSSASSRARWSPPTSSARRPSSKRDLIRSGPWQDWPSGTPVCTIRLAIPGRRRKGETDPTPVYVKVATCGAQAEAVANHMAKGRRVAVTGRLNYRE